MSTRCQIGIYENAEQSISNPNALLYKHCDGYPDGDNGMVALLMPFLKAFKAGRGISDTEYLPARLIQYLCNTSDADMRASSLNRDITDIYVFLSYGVCQPHDFHGDIEFFYRIHSGPDELRVYKCVWDMDPSKYELVESHKI